VRKASFFLLLGLLVTWSAALAKTPDGQPPSVETVCDGLSGAAFGLCNAYCEAMDCDSPNHHASDEACARVKENYEKHTGEPLPCEVACPCAHMVPLFAAIANGSAKAQVCLVNTQLVTVSTQQGFFAIVTGVRSPPFCSANLEPPFIVLTPLELVSCRVFLLDAAARQGIACVSPE
jgi:hypothetical protein